jgi:hypothetical protein
MWSEWRPDKNTPKSDPLVLATRESSPSSTMATLLRFFLSMTVSASNALSVA